MLAALSADRVIAGRYRIRGVLGKGGMGIVFKAEDISLRRMVALKLITVRNGLTDDSPNPQREERFLREASLAAQITHPNVVTIYDYGQGEEGIESFCYIAMELLPGETLGDRLRRSGTGLPMAEILPVLTQVTRGLRAAHVRGLVHRDLKPDNVMLTPGEDGEEVARLLDFGLAKDTSAGSDLDLTDAGMVMGTPEYMSPEQVEARPVDARTDLYALGILMFELVTGRPPFKGENAFRVAAAHVREAPPAMTVPTGRARPSVPFQDLVKKLLEKAPDARLQSADDLLRALRELPEARAMRSREESDTLSLSTTSRYQTGRKLSDTARAAVYEATHLELGRQVAIKIYRALQPSELARLKRELPAFALLRHPSNVRVMDVGVSAKSKGEPFLVMERIRGPSLRALLQKHQTLSWKRSVDLAIGILEGLNEAHTVGVLHRHLDPDHVLVQGAETRRESVKVIGYRIPDAQGDGSGANLLTVPDPAYLAPEVMRGGPVTERTDLFAAAVILHQCVLGRVPGSAVMAPRSGEEAAKPVDQCPAELAEVLRRAVSVDPGERYESAQEMISALQAVRAPGDHREPARQDSLEVSRASITHSRLRSTGQPIVWLLTGDPALRRGPITEVMLSLRGSMRVEEIAADRRATLATRLHDEDELPPWVVVFGGMHVILEDPLLGALAQTPEVSRLLVSTHANQELLESAINFCGLDHHVTLPQPVDLVRAAIEKMVARTGAARRYYDDLRLVAQRGTPLPGVSRADMRLSMPL